MPDAVLDDATTTFREGLRLVADNRVAEALAAFREVVERHPDHELADDALYDVGACYLSMSQFTQAKAAFHRLIESYPKALIASGERGHRETGPTAAKAWLGLVAAHLGMGDVKAAEAACLELAAYPDAKVVPAPGIERTFQDIGKSMLAAYAESHGGADTVTPKDVVG